MYGVQAGKLPFTQEQEDPQNQAGNEEILQMVQETHDA